MLWKSVGEAMMKEGKQSERKSGHVYNGLKGFGYGGKGGRAGPGNTAVRKLLEDERFTEAVAEFLRSTKVKKGVVVRG